MKKLMFIGTVVVAIALAVVLGQSGGARSLPLPQPTFSDAQLISSEHDAADVGGVSIGRADVLHAAGDPVRVRPRAALRGGHERAGRDDRDRRLLRQRHDRPRPARLRPGVRPAADVRRGRRDVHRRNADLQPARPAGMPGDGRRSRRRARARGSRTRRLGRSRSVLDVETAHAIAPMANILLVTTPVAETLGVQGFPQMMAAEDYVVQHHLATVISQSLASAEEAFGSPHVAAEPPLRVRRCRRERRDGARRVGRQRHCQLDQAEPGRQDDQGRDPHAVGRVARL